MSDKVRQCTTRARKLSDKVRHGKAAFHAVKISVADLFPGNCSTTRPRFVGQSSLPCFPLCPDTFRPIECARLRLLLSGSLALWLPAPLVFLPLPVPGGVALCFVHLLGGAVRGLAFPLSPVRLSALRRWSARRCFRSAPCLSSADFLQLPGASLGAALGGGAWVLLPSGFSCASSGAALSSSAAGRGSCFWASLGAALGWWRVGLAPCQHGYQFPAPL